MWFKMKNGLTPAMRHDPHTAFRAKSLATILCIVMVISLAQLWGAMIHGSTFLYQASLIVFVILCMPGLAFLFMGRYLNAFSNLIPLFVVLIGTLAGCVAGRHSFVPLLVWFPVLVFMVILVSGPRLQQVMPWLASFAALLLTLTPLLTGFLPLPYDIPEAAYEARVRIVMMALFPVPWVITVFYEMFSQKCQLEIQRLEAGLEKRRRRILLIRLAGSVVTDLNEPLRQLEEVSASCLRGMQKEGEARQCIQALSQQINRYRPLLIATKTLKGEGLSLQDLARSVQDFRPGTHYRIHPNVDVSLLLRGEHAFTLQIILILNLIDLQSALDQRPVCVEMECSDKHLILTVPRGSDGFIQEASVLLDDMKGTWTQRGGSISMQIPFSQIIE